ncbi:MAG: AAA family ATPase [Candidatus Anstonellales archaeon]
MQLEKLFRHDQLLKEEIKARLIQAEGNISIWNSILVFLGALSLLLAFPFYPFELLALIPIACGLVAYKNPPVGVVFGLLAAFPAIAYQSPLLGWMFLIPLSIALFYIFSSWAIISFLEIVILAPFASFPFSLFSPFVYLAMTLASLYVGSRESAAISIPSIFLILLLSSLWHTENAALLPINMGLYPKESILSNSRFGPVDLFSVLPQMINAISNLGLTENFQYASLALQILLNNIYYLLFEDSALFQIGFWAALLFVIGHVPARISGQRKQLIASSLLLLVPLFYFFLSQMYNTPYKPHIVPYSIITILIIGTLEHFNIHFAREAQIKRAEKVKQFGKFGLQDLSDSAGASSLDDIGGYDNVKKEIREAIITPLEQKGISSKFGLTPPKGILLFGPPGTGKTILVQALSKELSYGFYYVKCSDLLSQWYGESEKNLSEVFSIARKNAPCVLFFDEIDSIGKKRTAYSSDDVGPRLLSLFLQELDGFKTTNSVITIGATNIPNQLDPALLRPGRLDKLIYMPLPDFEARKAIFKIHTKKLPLSEDVDLARLASMTERFSGADIANACMEVARLAASESKVKGRIVPINMTHFHTVLSQLKPSVSLEALAEYEKFRLDFERSVTADKKKEKKTQVSWQDVAGLEDVKRAIKEAVELPLLHEDLIKKYKIKPSKGLLLFGPPGCGKTLVVKAASYELNATFLTLSGAELTKKGYDYAVHVIKETFNRARENAPALIFIDEIESIAPASASPAFRPLVSQLLTELDGVYELKNVMLIGATNKPKMLDPAILRPGRFDKIIYVPPPDQTARAEIFRLNVGDFLSETSKDAFLHLASVTKGFSGSDIASICQEAKMELVRNKIKGTDKKETIAVTDLVKIIKSRKPSITPSDLYEFEEFLEEYGERK